ncbi:MAG: short-chain dehydrogenase [Gammaproteobacteria bacterium]|jgi:NADP-dependent 3-hydroxy acid dehydrogenase YdfG|uniref:Short-chain dehydrogenase n=1 Tax=marine metagenome TaxID=408172 RepID=A0A381NGE9_9ZZZZ|nr:short-chain dehydrogenase [Gammaproteobacteria bacterium]|tara:strand:- start:4971 stop:5690 length:720 start_codon:yes stop_codon:yes gene_type:complete
MLKPNNRVILISGASSGIGLAIAKLLLEEGYNLSLGVRNIEKTKNLFSKCKSQNYIIEKFEATDLKTIDSWVENTINIFGKIDGLINNAGILKIVSFDEGEIEELNELWKVNVVAPFYLTKLCLPHIKKTNYGRIINIASTDGKRYRESVSVGYSMVKHALVSMSHATRIAGWNDGIRVTAICPGAVDTNLLNGIPGVTTSKQRLKPETIAHTVSYVLSLPKNASVAELPINARVESTI